MKSCKFVLIIGVILSIVAVGKIQATNGLIPSEKMPLLQAASININLKVPQSFLGLHINRWSEEPSIARWDIPMPGMVSVVDGKAFFTCDKGYRFSFQRTGVKVILQGMADNGNDFETTVTNLVYLNSQFANVAELAKIPARTGPGRIRYPVYVPTFGYGAIRSHDSGVNWSTLHIAKGEFNSKLMSAWVASHKGKRLMFTMSGTPEWVARSNITPKSRQVSEGVATIQHAALSFAIPVGAKIKIRNCNNAALNGEWVISASTPTSTSFVVKAVDEGLVTDANVDLLLWSNDGGYGYMNPPKDLTQVNEFVTWLMKNYGKNIDWIEGQNEANSGKNPQGQIWYSQGQGLWWAGSFDDLGAIMRRVNMAAKAVKPTVFIGSPSITGLHNGQPINQSPNNRANGYQLLSAGDGVGGKLMDWVDFVPFHVYDLGAAWQLSGDRTIYDTLYYLREMLASAGINKPNIPIYMNEGGFERGSPARKYFDSLSPKQQSNEVFKIAAIYAGFGVKGFYPYTSGFLGDFETTPEIAAAYDKVNKRIAGKTISSDAWFNKQTGEMLFKTTDGYEEYIP